jgi:hypothetical protein
MNLNDLMSAAPRRAHLRDVASWPVVGNDFLTAVQLNLDVAGSLFDDEFRGRAVARERNNVLAALSELWLAAHFLRGGWTVERIRSGASSGKVPDFRLCTSEHGNPTVVNVEAKRVFRSEVTKRLSEWDGASGFVSRTFAESDFANFAKERLRRAREQLRAARAMGTSTVMALDVSESTTFQRLMLLDDATGTDLSSTLKTNRGEAVFLFAWGLNRAGLWHSRWVTG